DICAPDDPEPPPARDDSDRLQRIITALPPEVRVAIDQTWRQALSSAAPGPSMPEIARSKDRTHRAMQLVRRVWVASHISENRCPGAPTTDAIDPTTVETAAHFVLYPGQREQVVATVATHFKVPRPEARRRINDLFQIIHSVLFWERIGRLAATLGAYQR